MYTMNKDLTNTEHRDIVKGTPNIAHISALLHAQPRTFLRYFSLHIISVQLFLVGSDISRARLLVGGPGILAGKQAVHGDWYTAG